MEVGEYLFDFCLCYEDLKTDCEWMPILGARNKTIPSLYVLVDWDLEAIGYCSCQESIKIILQAFVQNIFAVF